MLFEGPVKAFLGETKVFGKKLVLGEVKLGAVFALAAQSKLYSLHCNFQESNLGRGNENPIQYPLYHPPLILLRIVIFVLFWAEASWTKFVKNVGVTQ